MSTIKELILDEWNNFLLKKNLISKTRFYERKADCYFKWANSSQSYLYEYAANNYEKAAEISDQIKFWNKAAEAHFLRIGAFYRDKNIARCLDKANNYDRMIDIVLSCLKDNNMNMHFGDLIKTIHRADKTKQLLKRFMVSFPIQFENLDVYDNLRHELYLVEDYEVYGDLALEIARFWFNQDDIKKAEKWSGFAANDYEKSNSIEKLIDILILKTEINRHLYSNVTSDGFYISAISRAKNVEMLGEFVQKAMWLEPLDGALIIDLLELGEKEQAQKVYKQYKIKSASGEKIQMWDTAKMIYKDRKGK